MENILDKFYKAAIYLRLSKEDGDTTLSGNKRESNSITNQRKLIEDYLKKHPEITQIQEFCDDGFTGANFERPMFQRMIAKVKKREINCIIVKDLSRFGREYIEMGRYIEKIFPAMGVRFIAINDNYDSALESNVGNEIIIPFKNIINDSYSRDISIKIRSNLDIKRRNGEFVGNHVIYGYQRSEENASQLVVDKEAALVVQKIFCMKLDGYSPAQIAEHLNDNGIPSPYEYKRFHGSNFKSTFKRQLRTKWSPLAIYRILKNEMYTGTLIQGKTTSASYKVKKRVMKDASEWIRIENAHDAIISSATFDLVQSLMLEDTRRAVGDESVHLFSGKVFCADCQSSMIRRKTTSNGKSYVYFICGLNKQDKTQCSSHRIKEQDIYDVVLALIQSQVALALDLEVALDSIKNASWESRELERISHQIAVQEEAIQHSRQMKLSLYDDFKQEFITLDEYKMFKEDFDKKIHEATQNIAQLNGNKNKVKSGNTNQQTWLTQFHEYENIQELTRRVVVNFVERIEITDKKEIHVHLSNADQFESILTFIDEQNVKTQEMRIEEGTREVV